jgi:hypothetical protein
LALNNMHWHVAALTLYVPDSMRQQTYAESLGSHLQGDYDPELPPPAYEIVPNTGDAMSSAARTDVKSDTREAFAGPSSQADSPADAQTTYEPLAEPSAYARPPTITQETGTAASSAPPDYIVPSMRTDIYPRYSSPGSFSSPPLSTPSRNLLSFIGGNSNSSNQNQNLDAPPSFSRPLPQNLYYNTFPPTYLIANGKHLDDGFPVVPPPSPVQPHPFSSRDVREVDWIR